MTVLTRISTHRRTDWVAPVGGAAACRSAWSGALPEEASGTENSTKTAC